MAYRWPTSRVPLLDPCGDPYHGARVFFYAAGTTTPKTVYRDSELSIPHDHPVVASGSGMFPAIYMSGADYRERAQTAGGVVLWDDDGISIPSIGNSGGGGGDTPIELLARTGDVKARYGIGSHSGWVRFNGRSIGNGLSGASERANDDTEALYIYLWDNDAALEVAGGRGSSASSDFAANKPLTLPDGRQRALIGLASMGGETATLIPDALFDDGDGDVLGATVGEGEVVLTEAQMPSHNHSGNTNTAGNHSHSLPRGAQSGGGGMARAGVDSISSYNSASAGSHSHSLNINDAGGDDPHPNIQPSMAITFYIKL